MVTKVKRAYRPFNLRQLLFINCNIADLVGKKTISWEKKIDDRTVPINIYYKKKSTKNQIQKLFNIASMSIRMQSEDLQNAATEKYCCLKYSVG